jgi:hypothetical protein
MDFHRTRSAEVVLYLDLDGVVHHEAVYWHPRRGIYIHEHVRDRTLFEWIPQLQAALLPYPQVALVLSSSWCVRPGYAKTLKRFPDDLRRRFIGGTYHKRHHGVDPWMLQSFRETPRGEQILQDVRRRRPHQWLALDDDDYKWPPQIRDHLIHCDGERGLSDLAVLGKLDAALQKCCSAITTS